MKLEELPAPVFSQYEDKCTVCGVNPVYIGTMCYSCWEKRARPKPKEVNNMTMMHHKAHAIRSRLPEMCKCCCCVKRYCFCSCCCGK